MWLLADRLLQEHCVSDEGCDELTIADMGGEYTHYPVLDLSHYEVSQKAATNDEIVIQNNQGWLLASNKTRLIIATPEPLHINIAKLRFYFQREVSLVIVSKAAFEHLVEKDKDFLAEENELGGDDYDGFDEFDISSYETPSDSTDIEVDVNDTPVVKFVNKMLIDAIRSDASDIHFEPYEKMYRVRFRQDGVLTEVSSPPIGLANAIVARFKVMANLDISEKRAPQDGRFKLTLSSSRSIDFRLSTCPTLYGEKVVMRILDSSGARMETEDLGFTSPQVKHFLSAIQASHGMVLVTGPTGSGKTVTLYNALNTLNTADVNISTIEDPVEINMEGVNQVPVNVKTGMSFANTLRAFLRQDPDIMMVGEIRDLETAEIAVKAAQTGHLVLSTLHTNSAPETITRLLNMGVAGFNIASTVNLVIAQRLVRRVCEHCRQIQKLPDEGYKEMGFTDEEIQSGITLYQAVGCEHCATGKGYKGRIGIYEVMPVTKEMGHLIMEGAGALKIAECARKMGCRSLRESGLDKVREGLTTLEEVNRVVTE